MKTRVTQTSIETYHTLNKNTQLLLIAAFLAKETKAGKSHSIKTIAEHFMKVGNASLREGGTVSARLNDIKKDGIVYDGRVMHLELVEKKKNPTGRTAEFYWLVNAKQPQAATQGTLFNL